MTHTTPHILIVGQDVMFGKALQVMLSNTSPYHITRITPTSTEGLFNNVKKFQPDVVILITDREERFVYWRRILLEMCSSLYLIEVNAEENIIHLLYRERITIKQTSDLLSVIQGIEGMQGLNRKGVQ